MLVIDNGMRRRRQDTLLEICNIGVCAGRKLHVDHGRKRQCIQRFIPPQPRSDKSQISQLSS